MLTSFFIYELLEMLLKKNEVLDSVMVEGILNAHKDAFKKIVRYYVKDQNDKRRENNKEMRKQIMVEFGNLIHLLNNHLLSVISYFI